MRVDVNVFLGRYPFHKVASGSPPALIEAMDRCKISEGWISNLSSIFWTDPSEGNAVLYLAAAHQPRFRPVPAVHPEMPNWERVLKEAVAREVPAVRADPTHYGIDPVGGPMQALAAACGRHGVPLITAVKLEDVRQRHPNDRAAALTPQDIRTLIRSDPGVRLIVTHADREFVEQVHFGSTPAEAGRILWDICGIWGPPEDHLELLLTTVGIDRFGFGTGMPLRIPESSVAKMDLLGLEPALRKRIEGGNITRFLEEARQSA
jgi:uncharacterized protein